MRDRWHPSDFEEADDDLPAGLSMLAAVHSLYELRVATRTASAELLATRAGRVFDDIDLYLPLRERLRREAEGLTLGQFLDGIELHRRLQSQIPHGQLRRLVELMGVWIATRWQLELASGKPAEGTNVPPDITAWAEEHGVLDCAQSVLTELPEKLFEDCSWFRTPYDTVAGRFQPHLMKHREAAKLRDRLWSWLQQEARAVAEARARGPARPPRPADTTLGELWDRLSAAREKLDAAFPSRSRRIRVNLEMNDAPLQLDCEVQRLEGQVQGRATRPHVLIDLPRTGPVKVRCACKRDECMHQAFCLDVVLQVLGDEKVPLVAGIKHELTQAVWQKALAFQHRMEPPPRQPDKAVSFTIQLGGYSRVGIEALGHRIGKKGLAPAGKKVHALKALDYAGLTAQERQALQHLALAEKAGDYYAPDPLFVAEALLALVGHPRVSCAEEREMFFGPVTVRTGRIEVRFDETGAGVVGRVTLGGEDFDFAKALMLPFRGAHLTLCRCGSQLWLCTIDDAAFSLLSGLSKYQAVFPPEAHDALLSRLEQTPLLDAVVPPSIAGTEVPLQPTSVVRVEPSQLEGVALRVLTRPAEGAEPQTPGGGSVRCVFRREGQRFFTARDFVAERAQAEELTKQLELEPSQDFSWTVSEPLQAIALVDRLEGLARAGLEVEWPKTRWRLTRAAKTADVKVQVTRKRDWFGLDGEVNVDGERVQLAVLLDSVRRRQRWIKLKERQWLKLSQDLVERLQGLSHLASEGEHGLEVTWAALPALESLEGELEQLTVAKEFAEMMRRVREAAASEPKVPRGLKAELRDYQVQGYRWLSRLAGWGAGACLADDMGLGKTVQALALLLSRAAAGPALVVAPTSVVFNWRAEAKRFAPSLKVHEYRLSERGGLLEKLGPTDVVLTSWALLTRDAEKFAQVELATLVLDEAQAVKNASTQRAKAARGLKAGFKVALSGTPLENHLGELWSLYRVVLPGLFGSQEQFRQRFALPIERDNDADARAALAAVVRPFLLRRNKSEVAKELPPRTELMLQVELTEAERKLYDDARLAAIAELKEGEAPQEKKRFQALAALTRLRQIACHPRLYDEQWTGPASKLSRLLELLGDLKAAGHRALVFSQFTSHLGLVRDAVTAAGFTFQYLDGSTPAAQRQQRVEAFQRGEGELFLISLKAGGMGLNLTAADYVVHLDPWWNPAVEDQATDRAHRIGQDKPVTVYRLIASGTVEEGIIALHEEKRNLVAGVLDGSGAAGAMSTEELMALIRGG